MSTIFDFVTLKKPKRSVFDLSFENKLSGNMGDLIPIMCQEVLPGDHFKCSAEIFCRFQPMLAPMFHRVNVTVHFFFVPNRILWSNWETFITGGPEGTSEPVFPNCGTSTSNTSLHPSDLPNWCPGSLMDYLGIPVGQFWSDGQGVSPTATWSGFPTPFSLMPFAAYQKIYQDYYRDQNLDPEDNSWKLVDGGTDLSSSSLSLLRKRCWEKDYFTSALPWAQRGPQIQLPITSSNSAPVTLKGGPVQPIEGVFRSADNKSTPPNTGNINLAGSVVNPNGRVVQDAGNNNLVYDPNGSLQADLSGIGSPTINDVRRSFQLQKWLERNARSGGRYIEQILSHFGVHSSDARLQRSEYLGGGKLPVSISEVLQTSATQTTSPQGNMAGHAVAGSVTPSFHSHFEEHGFILGIMSVMPRTGYSQGLDRKFFKFDRYDYYWPEFSTIGEQSILNQELFYRNVDADNKNTFGYCPRYQEYRYNIDQVHGDFRNTLSYWHMARLFQNAPGLNSSFVHADPTTRVFADTNPNDDHLLFDTYLQITANRPVIKSGDPGYLDHH